MVEELLQRQLRIEQLISDVARKFVMVSEVSDAVNEALEGIGKFSNSSRAYIFEFDDQQVNMNNTFEWCEVGVSAEIDNLQELPISLFPWWVDTLRKGEILDIKNVAALGDHAAAEKDILESQGIKSVLVLPLFIKGELIGFVGFDNTEDLGRWSDDDQHILQVASELFSNAFARMRSEKELEDTNIHLENTLQELKATQSQLVRQEQMVAIGQLAAGVAHEINNPLAFMLSNQSTLKNYIVHLNEVLVRSEELTEKILEDNDLLHVKDEVNIFRKRLEDANLDYIKDDLNDLIEDVDLGIHRVSKIVEGLRYFSHVNSSGVLDAYNMVEGIENTLIVAGSKIRGHIQVEKQFQDEIPILKCNGGEINQVLLNLIMNAVDALENITDRKPLLKISVSYDTSNLYCEIKDNGCGMTEEVAEQVFNPFYTTKDIGDGTGLGMSIAYDIMKKNNGEIKMDTKVNEGTTFTLVLPY